jgi:hypothetical protein
MLHKQSPVNGVDFPLSCRVGMTGFRPLEYSQSLCFSEVGLKAYCQLPYLHCNFSSSADIRLRSWGASTTFWFTHTHHSNLNIFESGNGCFGQWCWDDKGKRHCPWDMGCSVNSSQNPLNSWLSHVNHREVNDSSRVIYLKKKKGHLGQRAWKILPNATQFGDAKVRLEARSFVPNPGLLCPIQDSKLLPFIHLCVILYIHPRQMRWRKGWNYHRFLFCIISIKWALLRVCAIIFLDDLR